MIARHHYEARTGERFFQQVEDGIPSHHTVEINKIQLPTKNPLQVETIAADKTPTTDPEAGLKFSRTKL